MKKLILFLICIAGFIELSHAQYPIPSYMVPVFPKATFVGDGIAPPAKKKMAPLAKRSVIITTTHSSPDSIPNVITVYIVRTDKSIILGPYYMTDNDRLEVEIDDQQWGVLVESEMKVDVSIWYEEY